MDQTDTGVKWQANIVAIITTVHGALLLFIPVLQNDLWLLSGRRAGGGHYAISIRLLESFHLAMKKKWQRFFVCVCSTIICTGPEGDDRKWSQHTPQYHILKIGKNKKKNLSIFTVFNRNSILTALPRLDRRLSSSDPNAQWISTYSSAHIRNASWRVSQHIPVDEKPIPFCLRTARRLNAQR